MSKPYDPIRDCSPSAPATLPPARSNGSSSLSHLLDGPPPERPTTTASASGDDGGLESPDMSSPAALPDAPFPPAPARAAPPPPQAFALPPPLPAPAPPAAAAVVNPYLSPASHTSSLPPRPSSSSSSSRQSQPPPPPPSSGSSSTPTGTSRSRTPYAPTRVSAPTTVLRPLSADEYESARRTPWAGSRNGLRGWKHGEPAASASSSSAAVVVAGAADGRAGSAASSTGSKRGHDGDDGPAEADKRPRLGDRVDLPGKPQQVGDVKAIASHYNHRPEYGKDNRRFSPIFGLKAFNNWIKSVLIGKFAPLAITGVAGDGAPAPRGTRRPGPKGSVLDLGCGKGGDLNKWNAARVARYTGLDIADVSITQAVTRAEDMRNKCFDFEFHAIDCFSEPLESVLPAARLDAHPFDLVTMQFCMHYAFETEAKARQMLANVSRGLKVGGVFIGTTPNAEKLIEQVLALPEETERLAFGNDVYSIEFTDRDAFRPFGHRYEFYLQDAVEDVPEYLVLWDNFAALAEEYGLHVVYKEEFHAVFDAEKDRPDFKDLLTRMRVVNDRGESEMSQDQWEAANLYLAFALEKR